MKKIVVCGNYGAGNHGDEAILDGILKILRKVAPQAQVMVMSSQPAATYKAHGVESVDFIPAGLRSMLKGCFSDEWKKTRNAIRECDLFILGGGGLLNDDHPRAIWIWWVQTYFAIKFGKKIACVGQSVGPLKYGWAQWLAKKIFSKAAVITVRDAKSLEVLKSIGITNAVKVADFVFAVDRIAANEIAKSEVPYIVVSLRPWKNLPADFLKELVGFLDWIVATKKMKLKLVPFQKNQDDDEAILTEVKAKARHGNMMEILPYNSDYRQVQKVVAGANAVIGMRLHSLIFAAIENVPFLGIVYSEKVAAMAQILKMEKFVLDPKKVKTSDYQKTFALLMADHEKIKTSLKMAVETEQKLVLEHVEIFKRLLE